MNEPKMMSLHNPTDPNLDNYVTLRYDRSSHKLPTTVKEADDLFISILEENSADLCEGRMVIHVECMARRWPIRRYDEMTYTLDVQPGIIELLTVQYGFNCQEVVINKQNNKFKTVSRDDNRLEVTHIRNKLDIPDWKIGQDDYSIRVYGDSIQDLQKKFPDDSGYDLRAINDGVIYAGQIETLSLGVAILFPKGYELQMRPRSGMTKNEKVTVFGGIGTIDYGYTGNVGVTLINGGDKPFYYKRGDRIAQCVLAPVITDCPVVRCKGEPPKIAGTRASGGFGHTGIK